MVTRNRQAAMGARFRDGIGRIATRTAVPPRLVGYPAMTYFKFNHPQTLALQTLLTVHMLGHGFPNGHLMGQDWSCRHGSTGRGGSG